MKKLIFIILLCPLFVVCCHAEELYSDAAEELGVYEVEDALPEDSRSISGELKIDGSYDAGGALSRLWDRFVESAANKLGEELSFSVSMLAISLFCSLASALTENGSIKSFINVAGCCTVSVLIVGDMDGIVNQAFSAITQLSDYSRAVIPAVFSAAAACGAVASASAGYAAVCIAMEIIMSVSEHFVIPTVYAYMAVSISRSIFDNPIMRAAANITKWCAVTMLTGITLFFSAYISLSGVIAGSADAVAVKTARTIISNSLPVVGGIISDSASVVLSAASLIKNSAGIFGLVSVCALCAVPFAELSVKMLIFKAAAAAAEMMPDSKIPSLINSFGTVMALLLGLLGCCGIMLFISIMAGIKVVTF